MHVSCLFICYLHKPQAYFLKSILHDWSDEQSTRILQAIRRGAPSSARLLLCEVAVPDDMAQVGAGRRCVVRPRSTMWVLTRAAAGGAWTMCDSRCLLCRARLCRWSRGLPPLTWW